MEIGCGVGNSLIPILADNNNPKLHIFPLDYSQTAIQVLKDQASPLYSSAVVTPIVWDLSTGKLPFEIQPGSVDCVLLVFVFSAFHPKQWTAAVRAIDQMLKPGGMVCFRDYGRWDMTQLRFKKNRLMEENLYVRGDGTRVYYFEQGMISLQ